MLFFQITRNRILNLSLAACFSVCASTLAAAPLPSVASRVAAQNALFEEQYQADLKAFPLRATAFGEYRYNDQLDDQSIAEVEREHATDESFLARLKAISTTGFTEQDILSHELMVRTLEQRNDDYAFKDFEMPVSQFSGPPSPARGSTPLLSVRHCEVLRGLHRAFAPDTAFLPADRRGDARRDERPTDAGTLPAGESPRSVPGHYHEKTRSSFPRRSSPASISPADQQRLTQRDYRGGQ